MKIIGVQVRYLFLVIHLNLLQFRISMSQKEEGVMLTEILVKCGCGYNVQVG